MGTLQYFFYGVFVYFELMHSFGTSLRKLDYNSVVMGLLKSMGPIGRGLIGLLGNLALDCTVSR